MADPLSIGASIAGLVSLTLQIVHGAVNFGLDWKDAPQKWQHFKEELLMLARILTAVQTALLNNPDFAAAFENRPSLILSQLGPNTSPNTEAKLMLKACEGELTSVLEEMRKREGGSRYGWERLKGTVLSKRTLESVQTVHRQYQSLTDMLAADTIVLGAATYAQVKNLRQEHQDTRKEQRLALGELQKQNQDSHTKDVLHWLSVTDYGSLQTDILERRQEGTGQWLLDSTEFTKWCNSAASTLYCHGMPGAGKTVITSLVVNQLHSRCRGNPGMAVAYLYCNYRRKDEQKPIDLLANILKQLVQQQSTIPASIERLFTECHSNKTRPATKAEILAHLHAVASGHAQAYIIVDALDELANSEGQRQELIAELLRLQRESRVCLFLTSRDHPQIERDLGQIFARLEIRAADEDVRRYVSSQLHRLRKFVENNHAIQEEVKDAIIQAVDGMFLLAQLHVTSVSGAPSPKSLRQRLRSLPKGSGAYDKAYSEAMERIQGQCHDDRELAIKTLSLIACAKRPLTVLELRHVLAIEDEESRLDKDNLPEADDILSACAGLVVVDDESQIIRLVHYTTQEYFQRHKSTWFPHSEDAIAARCMTYLLFDEFGSGFCTSDDGFEARLRFNPFYDYAARHWAYHTQSAFVGGSCSDLSQLVLQFLSSENKISASVQVQLVPNYHYRGYSQGIPRGWNGLHLAAYFGLCSVVGTLIGEGLDADASDSWQASPLSWAAVRGSEAMVKLLVERDDVEADSKDKYGRTPLSRAAEQGHEAVVKLLVERDDVEADSNDENGQTPLSRAAWKGHEAVVKLLVERDNVEADSKDEYGRTPLSRAAWQGHEAVVKLLVERDDVEADSKDKNGWTPLSRAADQGHEAVVKLLVERNNVEADSKDKNGWTPLSRAADQGHEAVVKLLVEQDNVEADSKDEYGRTPLSRAAWQGHEAVVKLLVERDDVEADSKDKNGWTPLSRAADQGHEAVVKLLVERNNVEADSKDKNGWTPLSRAADRGHEAVVKLLVERDNVEADSKDEYGRTPLSRAAWQGHEAVVKLLVERDDVEADSKDEDGQTPLSRAAWKGHEAVVKLLVERDDVEADSKDKHGQTPLSQAAEQGHEAVVKLLVERNNVKADSKDKYGQTPLSRAAWQGHEAVVKLLVERDDVEADSKNKHGWTPLSRAADQGHEAVVKLLVERDDVDVDSKDNHGCTPLLRAAEAGYPPVVTLLMSQNKVAVNHKDDDGDTPLHCAAWKGHTAVVQQLLDRADIQVNSRNNNGRSPLFCAARGGHEGIVKLLLDRADVDVNADDNDEQTPLLIALEKRHEAVVTMLLKRHDIAFGPEDSRVATPLLILAFHGNKDVESLLVDRGVQLDWDPFDLVTMFEC